MRVRFAVAAALGCLTAPALAPALAQETTADPASTTTVPETVVTATRIEDPIDRVPAAVTIIDRDDIEDRSITTLDQGLRTVPGFSVVRSGGLGQTTSTFVRGTNSNQVLVLLDGMPINDPGAPNSAFDFGNDLLGDVQRLEVVRGPASSLYGSSAIGGVVNILPRVGGDDPLTPFAEAAVGTEGTARGLLGVRGSTERVDYAVSAEGLTTDGDNIRPDRIVANLGEDDGYENLTLSGRAAVALTDTVRVDGLVRVRDSETEIDSFNRDDPNAVLDTRHVAWKLGGEADVAELGGGFLTARLDVGQSRYDRRSRNDPDALSASTTDDRFESVSTWVSQQNTLDFGDVGAVNDVTVVGGLEFREERIDVDSFTDVDERRHTWGLFGQVQGQVAERADLTLGVRHEDPNNFQSETTYRAGAVIALPEVNSRLLGSVGTAFRAPSLSEQFGFGGNPDLRAETSLSWEVGFETDVPAAGRADFATFGAGYFDTTVDDLIEFDPVTFQLFNIGEADIRGVESFVTVRPVRWAETGLAWTWLEARNADTGARLVRRPKHTLAWSAVLHPTERLTVSPEIVYVGDRGDVGGVSLGSYTLVNLAGRYQLTGTVELFATITNLLDRDYEDPDTFRGRGFNGLVGVRAEL
ncbi:MAG: TonB-dependent receptor domain-containing protein [Inquilinaceae bacterium]